MNASVLLFATVSIFRMGGDISVDDAPHGAVLRTMGGNIRVTRGAGRIVAKTMGGDIDIRQLDGSADVGSMGGDIKVNVVATGNGDHNLDVHTMGGEIEVTLPRNFDGDFSVELEEDHDSAPHRIVSDFPLEIHESTRWRLFGGTRKLFKATGHSGSATNHVKISTIGSNITIRRK